MKIYVLIGKSSTGKDTLYKKLLEDVRVNFKTVVTYTTRPIRDNEKDGVEYFFKTKEEYEKINKDEIIEERCYKTVYGNWYYFMMKDNQIDINSNDNYLLIGTLPTYEALKKNYGKENVIPLYIEIDDETRLTRAMKREKLQKEPKYEELCRRFLADAKDFSDNKLKKAGIKKRYNNTDSNMCLDEIIDDIDNKNNMMEVVKKVINNFGKIKEKDAIIDYFQNISIGDFIDYRDIPGNESNSYVIVLILHKAGFLHTYYKNTTTSQIVDIDYAIKKDLAVQITEKQMKSIAHEFILYEEPELYEYLWKVEKL